MDRYTTQGIVLVLLLGLAAQWVAWRVRLPSILLLLVAGMVAGPLAGWIRPNEWLGDAFLPLVSLSVAIILFEGGLSLRIDELRKVGRVVRNLLTIGVLLTWFLAALAGYFIAGLDAPLAVILGALLTVTGPTVIFPMLRYIRPRGRVATILRWEGIAIDPIGALLAVLAFEFVLIHEDQSPTVFIVGRMVSIVVLGSGVGFVTGYGLALVLHRFWIPDHLMNPVALTTAVSVFFAAERLVPESGLFAVTVAGFVLSNRGPSEVRQILEFKENLRVLLISLLFVVLSARFTYSDLLALVDVRSILFVGALILLVRPLSVFGATLGSELPYSERCFLAGMAPRGIVAAAVSSVFALQLEAVGHRQAKLIMLLTFATIIGTVAIYGLGSAGLARRLGLAERNPQGILIIGAQQWACRLAKAVSDLGIRVLLMDTNRAHTASARLLGLPTYSGSALTENLPDKLDLAGIGRLMALTPNDEVNALAGQQFARIFERANVYQLPPKPQEGQRTSRERHLHGRWLFASAATFPTLNERMSQGWSIKVTKLTDGFDYREFRHRYGEAAMVLFVVNRQKRLNILTVDESPEPVVGETLISLVPPDQGSART